MAINSQILEYSLVFSLMFLIGVAGVVLNRTNIIAILISLEIALLSVSLNFLIFSCFLDDVAGQVFALLIIAIAACESSIGLAIIIVYYRARGDIVIQKATLLRS